MSESGSESQNSETGKREHTGNASLFQEHMIMAGEYISQQITPKRTAYKAKSSSHEGGHPNPPFSQREEE